MTTESDRLLITRVRKNDQSAWAELDKRYRGRLTAYVRRRLKDHASVEDVAAAVRYLSGPESSWVTGVAFPIDGGHHLRHGANYGLLFGE